MPLVSIILPTRDRRRLLARSVASVLAQSEPDYELLIVDNNRDEAPVATTAEARGWCTDPRVRIVSASGAPSASAVRNIGLAAAGGAWITYLDDDDAYRPAKLARQLARACATGAGLVLCGAMFHLRGRLRAVQCDASEWRDDALILRARWNTPLLLHRHPGSCRFDESLRSGEDAEFAHRLLVATGTDGVPVVAEPLVDIYPQPGPRVNTEAGPQWRAAARILAIRRTRFSRAARRRYVLQAMIAQAKLARHPLVCAGLGWHLIRESGGTDWRVAANSLAVSLDLLPGRWVS
jgi:hypothetical protein